MKNRFIGLDIGGTKCAVVLASVDGGIRILDKISFDTGAQGGGADHRAPGGGH